MIKEYVREHMTAFKFGGVRIDWLKPMLPFYSRVLANASLLEWTEGHMVRVATAEGLILTKMVSFRLQDQVDIETLLTANRDTIDMNLIRGSGRHSRRPRRNAQPGSRPSWRSESCGESKNGLHERCRPGERLTAVKLAIV